MQISPKFIAFLIIGFLLMSIISVILQNHKLNNSVHLRYSDHLNGVIVRVNADRGSAFGRLKDGRRVFFTSSENYDYERYNLGEFLRVGDSIEKVPDSDTLYIYRKGKRYFFRLASSINEKEQH